MKAQSANPYCQRARLTRDTFVKLIQAFACGESALSASLRIGVSTRSVNQIWNRVRRRMASEREQYNPLKALRIEAGERRVRGRRPEPGETYPRLVGIRTVGQQLICEWVPADQSLEAFRVLYRQRIFCPEKHDWGYEGLMDLDTGRLFRLPVAINRISTDPSHPLSLEQFRQTLQARQNALCGWPIKTFYLHLKEAEWRHAYLGRDMLPDLLKLLRRCPI